MLYFFYSQTLDYFVDNKVMVHLSMRIIKQSVD